MIPKEAPQLFSYTPIDSGERTNVKEIPLGEVREKVKFENNQLPVRENRKTILSESRSRSSLENIKKVNAPR